MSNVTKNKEEYIRRWTEHADYISVLGMNKDPELSKRVFEIVKELKEIIPKVAELKEVY